MPTNINYLSIAVFVSPGFCTISLVGKVNVLWQPKAENVEIRKRNIERLSEYFFCIFIKLLLNVKEYSPIHFKQIFRPYFQPMSLGNTLIYQKCEIFIEMRVLKQAR